MWKCSCFVLPNTTSLRSVSGSFTRCTFSRPGSTWSIKRDDRKQNKYRMLTVYSDCDRRWTWSAKQGEGKIKLKSLHLPPNIRKPLLLTFAVSCFNTINLSYLSWSVFLMVSLCSFNSFLRNSLKSIKIYFIFRIVAPCYILVFTKLVCSFSFTIFKFYRYMLLYAFKSGQNSII